MTRSEQDAARRPARLRRWLTLALCLAVSALSLAGAARLTYEASFIAIVEPPERAQGASADGQLARWQDPPLSLLLTWRGESVEAMGEALSGLVFDLAFEEGVEEVVSVFTPVLPATGENPLSRALDTGGDARAALEALRRETLLGPSLLSADLRQSLLQVQGGEPAALSARYAACEDGAALCVRSIGSKTIERTIQRELRSENAVLPGLSALLSLLALTVFFGSLRGAARLMIPPLAGGLWYFGAMGWLGIPFDPFNAIIPTAVMTLGTANMLHLQRARDIAGAVESAGRTGDAALRAVLPAITITTGTTAVAFGSLYFEGSALLERLALSGVLGVSILWLAVVALGPWCLHARAGAPLFQRRVTDPLRRGVQALLARRRLWLRRSGIALAALGALTALNTPSDFTFHENIPEGETARAFEAASAAGLTLAPIFFTLDPEDDTAAREAIAGVYDSAAWDAAQLARLQTDDGRYVLPYPVPFGTSASAIEAEKRRVTGALARAGAVMVSGYPSNVSDTVMTVITNLQYILFACFALHALVIGLVMRSGRVALASFIPNALPIFAIYLAMLLTTGWINIAAAVAMILVSGLVVDDTTHILWGGRSARGFSVTRGLETAFEPVLLTTLVLAAGFSPLLVSTLPGLVTLGGLMILALAVAWLADVLCLPALFREDAHAKT